MELPDILGDIKTSLEKIYQSKEFPVIWFAGFALMAAVANDAWWVLPGVAGFIYWLVWKVKR